MSRNVPKFIIVKDNHKGYRWTLVVRGDRVAVSAKSYKTAANAKQAAAAVARNASAAELPQ